jgi:hypothetical protein
MRIIGTVLGLVALAFGLGWLALAASVQGPLAHAWGTDAALSGFPARLDLAMTEFRTESQDGALVWQGEALRLRALVHDPLTLAIDLPKEQMLLFQGMPVQMRSVAADAQLALDWHIDAPIKSASARLAALDIAFLGLIHRAEEVQTTLAQADGAATATITARMITPDPRLRTKLDPTGTLPAQIDLLALDAVLTLTHPLALRRAVPQVQALVLESARLDWGPIRLSASAHLSRDAGQMLNGQVQVQVTGWPDLLALLARADVVRADMVPLVQGMAAGMTDPATGVLTLPLSVRASQVALGPFVLGQLPPI